MIKQSLFALAAALCFSVMAAFVKYCALYHSPQELVFYRSIFAVFCLFIITRKPGYSLKTRYPVRHFIRSFLGILCVFIWFYAIGELPFGTCMTLSYTSPIFLALTYIVYAWIGHRDPPWALVFSILLGFVGILLVTKPTADIKLIPTLVCIGSAVLEVPIKLQMKAMGKLKEPSYRIVFYFSLLGTLLSAFAVLVSTGFHMGDRTDLFCLLGVMVLGMLGQLFITRSFAYGNVLLSAYLGFSAIPISALIGWLVFDETTDFTSMIGMAIIIVVGICATTHTRDEEVKERKEN